MTIDSFWPESKEIPRKKKTENKQYCWKMVLPWKSNSDEN